MKKKYVVSIGINHEVKADNENEAIEKFWKELEDSDGSENTILENILLDSLKVKEVD